MSGGVLNNILAVDKEQELLQSFIRTGNNADEESLDEGNKRSRGRGRVSHKPPIWERRDSYGAGGKSSTERGARRASKHPDDIEAGGSKRGNRIEAELRAARKRIEEQMMKKKKPKENFVDF